MCFLATDCVSEKNNACIGIVQSLSGHVWMWEFDYKESWALKNWCFWTVVLEKTLEHPLDCKEIRPVHSKGDQSWMFIGRTDVEAKTPILWPPDAESWLVWKDPDAGKDWGQEEKGTTEDEMVGWHHRHNGHESEWTPGVGDGQGGLACCSPWGRKESDMTERLNLLNWTHPHLCSMKETGTTAHKRVLSCTSPPSPHTPSFLNRVTVPCLSTSSPSLSCHNGDQTELIFNNNHPLSM